MISTNLSPLGITWECAIDNVPFSRRRLQRISISLVENQHDLATIEVVGVPSNYLMSYIDRPVYLKIEILGKRICRFYGYVSRIDAESSTNEGLVNNSPFQSVKIVCLGTSYLTMSKQNAVWENVSLTDIISEISSTYRYGYSVPNNKHRFKRLVQSETSVWQFLVKTVGSLGYSVNISNSYVHVWDSRVAAARQTSYSELTGTKVKKLNYKPTPGSIISFKPTFNTLSVNGSGTHKVISYIDNLGKVSTVSLADLELPDALGVYSTSRFTDMVSTNVATFDSAKQALIAGSNRAQLNTCETTVYGDPSITPGGVVKVSGYSSNFDGFWYVQSVTHELVTDNLLTHLGLSKNASSTKLPKFPNVQRATSPPLPILLNNKWALPREYANVYN